MENNKIKIFLNEKYINYDYDSFINMFVKNGFLSYKNNVIEKYILIPLKIEENYKQKVINSFVNNFKNLESYIINATAKEKTDNNAYYIDSLYSYLVCVKFILLNTKQKIIILKKLNVDNLLMEQVIKDFTLDTFK